MPEGYRELFVSQSGSAVTRMIAARIRQPVKPDLSDLDEPERPAMRAAEQLVATSGPQLESMPAEGAGVEPSSVLYRPGLFDRVYDREQAKLILERALRSRQPVHVLLVGDAASGKSQLLECCATLPQTRYAVGGMTTSAGLVEYLLERPGTQLLLIDEFGKADMSDYAALYSLMEQGQVPRLQHGKTEVIRSRARIFAATNEPDLERIPEALRSRFVVVRLDTYTVEQVRAITEQQLVRHGMTPARARQVAAASSSRSLDPRDGVQLGRLADEDGDLDDLVGAVIPARPAAKRGKTG